MMRKIFYFLATSPQDCEVLLPKKYLKTEKAHSCNKIVFY